MLQQFYKEILCGAIELSVETGLYPRTNRLATVERSSVVAVWSKKSGRSCGNAPRHLVFPQGEFSKAATVEAATYRLHAAKRFSEGDKELIADAQSGAPLRYHVRSRPVETLVTYGPSGFDVVRTNFRRKGTAHMEVVSLAQDCNVVEALLDRCANTGITEAHATTLPAPSSLKARPWSPAGMAAYFRTTDVMTLSTRAAPPMPMIGPAGIPVYLWRNGLSAMDGPRCPHIPTCSQYCVLTTMKRGLFQGLVRTAARMIGEGGELEDDGYYQYVLVDGRWRLRDPAL